MLVKPTKKTLRAMYEMMCTLPPFSRMRMPPVEKMRFRVRHDAPWWGYCALKRGTITITLAPHHTLLGLVATMAHEMVHAHQAYNGRLREKEAHNDEFLATARTVCSKLGIEVGGF